MPVRIYALAKELKVDSKDLVDLCAKAGITGKGSALASLTDDESAKVRSFLAGGGRSSPAASAKPNAPSRPREIPVLAGERPAGQGTLRREDYIAPGGRTGKLKTIPARPGKSKQAVDSPPLAAESDADQIEAAAAVPDTVAESPDTVLPDTVLPDTVSPDTVSPDTDSPETTPKGTQPPGTIAARSPTVSSTSKIIPLGSNGPSARSTRRSGSPKPVPRPSSPRLAPMPNVQAPRAKAKSNEPAPQKPDIRLPADAIRASKAGSKPLSEHLRKHEEKRAAAESKPKAGKPSRGAAVKAGAGEPVSTGRGRGRKGKGQPDGKAEGGTLLGGRAQRQIQRKRTDSRRGRGGEEMRPRRPRRIRRTGAKTAAPRKEDVVLELPCSVRDFCGAVGIPVANVLREMMQLGTMVNINSQLGLEQAEWLAETLEAKVELRQALSLEDRELTRLQDDEEDTDKLQPRPPIITFLGHVDHGKTSLLDKIIDIDVVSGESGGITQHIRAYNVERDGRQIAFVDTPGHEAFTEMRARGANVTDIAVLVVAADDGLMPQTEEAISHARAADVPIVVALNKIDLPGVNIEKVYQQLATNELVPAEWSPDGVEVVKTSAITGEGIDELIETLLLTADLQEYQANPDRAAVGTCLEAHQEQGRGVVAKMIVQKGTLRVGDVVVCGGVAGRVQAMFDTLHTDRTLTEAGPSMPVNVTGFDDVPGAGDGFHVLDDIVKAREIASQRADRTRASALGQTVSHVTLENLFDRLGERREVQTLNLILRADVRGSIEAITKELGKLQHDEVQIKILQALVGGITEADVHLAHASDAIVIGFNVVADEGARLLADKYQVNIRRYDIIYKLSGDLKKALEGKLRPEKKEVELGRALVQQTFTISRVGTIAGCRVISGTISRNTRVRVIRESRVIGDYPMDSLRREKDDTKEVREGMECGIKLSGFNDVKEADVLEVYRIDEVQRTLD